MLLDTGVRVCLTPKEGNPIYGSISRADLYKLEVTWESPAEDVRHAAEVGGVLTTAPRNVELRAFETKSGIEPVFEDDQVRMDAHHLPILTPLADEYADFVVRECATAGMIHAAMASMSPLIDLGALSPDENECVEKARELLLQVHASVLARTDYRKKTLAFMRKMADETPPEKET